MVKKPQRSLKRQTNIRLDEDLLAALQEVKDRHGTPASEAVRRALRMWLASEGVKIPRATVRKGGTRKR